MTDQPTTPPTTPPPEAPPAPTTPPPAATQPPAPTPPPNGTDWTQTLAPELREVAQKNGWKDPNEAVKGYQHLVTKLGLRRVAPLGEKASEAEIKEYREIMGIPETPDGYKPPEGLNFENPELYGRMAQLAHKHHVPPTAFNSMAAALQEIGAEAVKAENDKIDAAIAAEIAGLQKSWGGDFEANQAKARATAKALGWDDQVIAQLGESKGAGLVLTTLTTLHEKYGIGREGALHGVGGAQGFTTVDPATARAEIDNIRASKEWQELLGKRGIPETHPLKAKMRQLEDIAYGTKQVATVGR